MTLGTYLNLTLVFVAVTGLHAKDFVFENRAARLVVRSNAVVSSLLDKQNGKERLGSEVLAFAAVRKGGQLFPASAAERRGDLLHVTFGNSGVDADYRISAQPEYITVELAAFHGDGIEEIRLLQLNVALANAGGLMDVRWDDEFAVCLMGLSARVNSRIDGELNIASVYPEFGMQGERVAIVAVPTPQFLEAVRKTEQDFRLPSPTLGGTWAKGSESVRTSYLFTDLTEANADEVIRFAKLGGFRYILVWSGAWSASLGSYPINTQNFPRGEESLKAVIDKCHSAGLKVGVHMLTSFVGKDDPLVQPKPSPWLLRDAEATLATDTRETATELPAASSLAAFPAGGYSHAYSGSANDILIDSEIVHYGRIDGTNFVQCVRGYAGTKPEGHKTGTKIHHLVERYGSYLADLKTPLKDAISDRVAGVINRCGFDMIYFDGGEVNGANGPGWYWLAPQQMQIWEKSKRELLVQGSGTTPWTWHIFSRGNCDDYSTVAVKEYLDYHKIADSWRYYHNNFLPTDLGWWGFLQDTPDHLATTPDEVEYYATRMLALDSAVSLETNLNALKSNGRTEEMLKLLGEYEQLRLGNAVPKGVRQQLATGDWHMTRPGEFHPIRYDAERAAVPGEIALSNEFADQPLKFRLRVVPSLSAPGNPANITLLRAEPPVELGSPDSKATLPGSLIKRYMFTQATNGPSSPEYSTPDTLLDLTKHRALAVRLDVEGMAGQGEPPVLNIQLEADGGTYRDYYIDVNFSGRRTVILAEPGTKRTLAEFRPAFVNYPFKAPMHSFNYGRVSGLNLRWMRHPRGSGVRCRIGFVEALEERNSSLGDLAISDGSFSITIPGEMTTGDYAEYWADGAIRIFDRNGVLLSTSRVSSGPQLRTGQNKVTLKATRSGTVVLTAITLGK
jgi:hypothetical protein